MDDGQRAVAHAGLLAATVVYFVIPSVIFYRLRHTDHIRKRDPPMALISVVLMLVLNIIQIPTFGFLRGTSMSPLNCVLLQCALYLVYPLWQVSFSLRAFHLAISHAASQRHLRILNKGNSTQKSLTRLDRALFKFSIFLLTLPMRLRRSLSFSKKRDEQKFRDVALASNVVENHDEAESELYIKMKGQSSVWCLIIMSLFQIAFTAIVAVVQIDTFLAESLLF